MSNAKLSVIVPIYGVEQYLDRCIQSIVNVNYKNIEIILVDDGSKDGCPAICDSWEQKDNRIKVIHKPNGGLVSARKAGLEIATGEYATYVDGDDWIEPEMYDCLEQYDVDLIVEGFVSDDGKNCKKVTNRVSPGQYKDERKSKLCEQMILDKNRNFIIYPNVWNKVYRRNKLVDIQFQVPDNISLGEDVAVTYSYLIGSKEIVILDSCYYHYIHNPNSMTTKKDVKYLEKCMPLFDYLMDEKDISREQLCDYMCSMMISGISILLDPRMKIRSSYLKYMVAAYHKRAKMREYIEQGSTLNMVALTVRDVPSYTPFSYGIQYLASLLSVLPDTGGWKGGLVNLVGTLSYLNTKLPLGDSYIAELYHNFGWFAMPFASIIGFFIGRVDQRIEQNVKENNYLYLGSYLILFRSLLWMVRCNFFNFLYDFVWSYIIIYLATNIVVRYKKRF